MSQKIKAVIFDMDGVLFDTERICTRAWLMMARDLSMEEGMDEAISHCVGLNATDTRAYFMDTFGKDFPFDTFDEGCRKYFKQILLEEGLPIKKGVFEILSYLKEEGLKIGLASSTKKEGVMGHLEKAGITSYFESVTGGDMVLHSKPDPEIYLMACRDLCVDPKDALAIEDSPNGLKAAYGAGMMPVMVPDLIAPTPEVEKLLFAKCDDLLQVIDLIKERK